MALSTAMTLLSTGERFASVRRNHPSSFGTVWVTRRSGRRDTRKCRRLVVGTGEGALPVMDEVRGEARRRKVELLTLPTEEAMELLNRRAENTNTILHVPC